MKTPRLLLRLAGAGLITLAALGSLAPLKTGDKVFAKRNDTPLLAEPKPLASTTVKVGFAETLKIAEVRGNWLRVTAKAGEGWVFVGNIAEDKPKAAPAALLTTVEANETTTAAAARPLAPAAEGYAERHDAAEAKADVEWVDATAKELGEKEIVAYLRDNKKGEFQP